MSLYTPEMMVSSVEELIERCQLAKQLKLSQSSDPDDPIRVLCFPLPREATNAQIDKLKPLYHQLLPNADLLRPLEASPEEAIMYSYVLAYPMFIRISRDDQGVDTKSFPLFDILERISTDDYICTWCRETLHDTTMPTVVYGSSVIILDQSLKIADKNHFHKTIFRGEKNSTLALDSLQRDIEQAVNRNDMHGEDVSVCINYFFRACMQLKGSLAGALEMNQRGSAFHGALRRCKRDIPEGAFNHLAMIAGMQIDPMDALAVLNAVTIDDGRPKTAICDADGCNKTGEKVCALCGLASYCSKSCQTRDWKARHKHACGGKKSNHPSKANRKK